MRACTAGWVRSLRSVPRYRLYVVRTSYTLYIYVFVFFVILCFILFRMCSDVLIEEKKEKIDDESNKKKKKRE